MKRRSDLFKHAVILTTTVGIGIFSLFPFYWAIVTSLRSSNALFEIEYFPKFPTFENYFNIFHQEGFVRSLLNSVTVAFSTVTIALLISTLAAYAFARVRFRGRGPLMLAVLAISMFPQVTVLTGMFELIRWLGLYNQLMGLTLCYLLLVLPFSIWVLTSFLKAIPREIEEAAILDGCGPWRIIFRVFLPILRPAIATTGILAFITAWNEFLFALTFTLSAQKRTVPVAIAMLSGNSQYELPWGMMMAASVLVTVPLIGVVLIFQRQIVSGLTAGAVKG